MASGMRHQPLERAGGALAQHRDRGDQEHRDQREDAEQRHARSARNSGVPSKTHLISAIEHARHDEHQRERARVAAQLRQHAAAPWPGRIGGLTPPALDQARKASSMASVPVAAQQELGGVGGEDAAVAHEQEGVAALGLVHHVARDEQGRAAVGEAAEHRPEVVRSTGSRPTVGSSSTSSSGSRAARPRATRAPAGRRRGGRPGGRRGGRDRPSRSPRRRAAGRAEHAGEVAQVLADGQVGVDRRRLRDVADPAAQAAASRPAAEHVDRRRPRRSGRPRSPASGSTCRSRWGRAAR